MPYGYGSANTGKSSSSSGGGGYRNIHQTGAITQTPGRRTWSPGVGGTQHIPKTKKTVTTGGGWTPGVGGGSPFTYTPKTPITSGIIGSNKFKQFQKWLGNNEDYENIELATAATLGPLSFLKGKEYLGDVSKINQWSNMGYGTGNPVPQYLRDTLKGSWLPNKTFEKLGYGPGSLKDWWNKTISPKHFQPAQKVINPALKGLGALAKVGTGPMGWATTAALSTPSIINALTEREPGATESSLFGIDLTQNANMAGGGLIDLYRYGGFI